jgi:hypothetical protein
VTNETCVSPFGRWVTYLSRDAFAQAGNSSEVGFHGSPTISVDGRDPFATGAEPVGMMCRVYATQEGRQGALTESRLWRLFARDLQF